jgi:hypothetical protein
MIERQIVKPIPVPLALVVKNASKIRLTFFGSTPVPVSSTDIITSFDLSALDFTRSTLFRPRIARIASVALLMTFNITR